MKKKHIICIDDEHPILNELESVLGNEFPNHKIDLCESGTHAIKKINRIRKRGDQVECIVFDQRMPKMIGTEVVAEIQKSHPDVPSIMLTGYADYQAAVEAINNINVNSYIKKPWGNNENLVGPIREALKQYDQMVQTEKMAGIGQLAAGVAHQINNPLAIITSSSKSLQNSIPKIAKFYSNLVFFDIEQSIKKKVLMISEHIREYFLSYPMIIELEVEAATQSI